MELSISAPSSRFEPSAYFGRAVISDDYRNSPTDPGTLGALSVGGAVVAGNIETAGDIDTFAVTLEAHRTYDFVELGSSSGAGTLTDPYLYLADGSNAVLAYNDNRSEFTTDSEFYFSPSASGTYYVEAGAAGTATRTYTVSVRDTDTNDDYRNSPNGSGALGSVTVNGADTTGVIEAQGDIDTFTVSLQAGQLYKFFDFGALVLFSHGQDVYTGTSLSLVTDSETVLASNSSGADGQSQFSYVPDASGTYYLEASANSNNGANFPTGNYTINAVSDDYRDSPTGIGPLGAVSAGGTATGKIETPGDYDTFAVSFQAGHIYTFDQMGSASGHGTLGNPYLFLVDGANRVLAYNDDANGGRDSEFNFTPTASGTYYVVAGAAGSSEGTYTVAVADHGVDDCADSPIGPGALGVVSVGGTATGSIDAPHDHDAFAVFLQGGHTYVFGEMGAPSGHGTLSDPYLFLVDGANNVLAYDDDANGTLDSQLAYTPGSNGWYYLDAGGAGSNTGTYTVAVHDTHAVDDYADSPVSPGALGSVAVDGTASGALEAPHDYDTFAVFLDGGHTYTFDELAAPSGAGTLGDPYLYLENGANQVIAYNDDANGSLNSEFAYTPSANGYFYLVAGAAGAGTGSYTVAVHENAPSS